MQKTSLVFILYLICVAALSAGQFAALGRGEMGNFYLFDFAVALYSGCGLIFFLRRGNLSVPTQAKFLGLFFIVAALSLLAHITTLRDLELLTSAFYLIRLGIYVLTGIISFNLIEQRIVSLEAFLKALFYSGLVISVAGFIQLVVLPDFTVLDASLGWDPHKNRLASTFFDPNFTGGYLSMVIGLALGSVLLKKINLTKLETFLFIVVPCIAVILTFSRSSWANVAIVLFVLGVLRARKLLLLGAIVAFLAYFAVPRVQTRLAGITDPADSAAFRLASWSNSIQIAQDNIFLGVGYNAYRYIQQEYGFFDAGQSGGNSGAGSDSSLLFILATTGVVGLTVLLLGLTTSFIKIRNRGWGLIIFAVIAGILVQSQFINLLFYPQMLFFWPTLLNFTNFSNKL